MSHSDPFVCTGCVDEPGIQDFIENNKVDQECSYCENKDIPVAALDDVTDHMESCIKEKYDDTNEWAVYDSESGYRVRAWDTWDLLTDELQIDLPNDHDMELLKDIISRLPENVWCDRNPFEATDQEKARYDWAWFSEVVMHRRRFFFENYGEPDDDNMSPGDLLEKIFESTESYELFEILPSETRLFRARFQRPAEKHTSAQDLGPPPKELATKSKPDEPSWNPHVRGRNGRPSELSITTLRGGCQEWRKRAATDDGRNS